MTSAKRNEAGFYKCEQALPGLRTELIQSLSAENIEALRSDMKSMGLRKWTLWVWMNIESIQKFLMATPSQRSRRAEWNDPDLRNHIFLAGIRLIDQAEVVMKAIEYFDLYPGHSYRENAARAAGVYHQIHEWRREVPDWPFEDPDPFLK